MYNEKLAVAIKSAGKVLREFKDTVYVPFGAEYSIFIKNLNSVRALVKVSIDNQQVDQSGDGFVIGANDTLDLERFLKNGNLKQGNRFKFIERTGKIEQHRGIGIEDGLIRVEFQYEKVLPKVEEVHHHVKHIYHDDYWDGYYRPYRRPFYYHTFLSDNSGGCYGGSNGLVGSTLTSTAGARGISGSAGQDFASNTGGETSSSESEVVQCNYLSSGNGLPQNAVMDSMINEAGITVAGSKSDQQFTMVSSFPLLDETHVIVLKLLGETAKGKKIVQAVTVKSKQKCPTCGHVNKANAKFCTECGTALGLL